MTLEQRIVALAAAVGADIKALTTALTGYITGAAVAATYAPKASPVFTGVCSVQAILETATITNSAPASTTAFDVSTQAVCYYTTAANQNFTLNVRGNSTTSLNAVMQTGQACTVALLVTNGGTAYYPTGFQIDGNSVTPKWQGGAAPTAGNARSVDIYSLTIVKTGSAAFTVFASQTKFA